MFLLLLLSATVFCIGLSLLLLYWHRCCCTYWQRRGICGPDGWPLVGNLHAYLCGREHYGALYERLYKQYAHLHYVGIYQLWNEPAVLVRSAALVRAVLQRRFRHFQHNALHVDAARDAIVAHNPFVACGSLWRQRRNELAAMFTPTKLKLACRQMRPIVRKLLVHVERHGLGTTGVAFEAKQLCCRYTLAVVAAIAFGLDARTLHTDDAGNDVDDGDSEFMHLIAPLFAPHRWSLLETTALLFSPLLARVMRYRYMPLHVQQWLQRLIGAVLQDRLAASDDKRHHCRHQDIIQWLIEQQQQQQQQQHGPHQTARPHIARDVIVGHCGTLLLEGFETSAALMAFALYELARHTHIQQAVQRELDQVIYQQQQQQHNTSENNNNDNDNNIDNNIKHINNVICYEMLQQLNYLEAVLYETLRLHPAMQALFKRCTADFMLPMQHETATATDCYSDGDGAGNGTNADNGDGHGGAFKVHAGTVFIIPVQAIHHDAELYAEPRLFKPERFYKQQQQHGDDGIFLGFGDGPRMCPGMRLGLAQIKAGIAALLHNYNVHLAHQRSHGNGDGDRNARDGNVKGAALKIAPSTFLTNTIDGIWLRFSRRS